MRPATITAHLKCLYEAKGCNHSIINTMAHSLTVLLMYQVFLFPLSDAAVSPQPASKDNVNALVRNRFKNFFFNPVIPFFAYCSLRFLYVFNQVISPIFINRKLSIFSFIHICLTPIYLGNSSLLLFRLVFYTLLELLLLHYIHYMWCIYLLTSNHIIIYYMHIT